MSEATQGGIRRYYSYVYKKANYNSFSRGYGVGQLLCSWHNSWNIDGIIKVALTSRTRSKYDLFSYRVGIVLGYLDFKSTGNDGITTEHFEQLKTQV